VWDWYGFDKNHASTRYTQLVFLHPVGSMAHVVYSGESGLRKIGALFFMLGRYWYGFYKKCAGTRYGELVFLHHVRSVGHVVHSSEFGS
jgi:hypothetical protein